MTEFKFFIACLPEWDGKDRVTELEKLVKAETKILDENDENKGYRYRDYSDKWVRRVIREILRGVTDIFFIGEQGIGKSTLIRYLLPFECLPYQSITNAETILSANCISVHEAERFPNQLPDDYSGSLICYLSEIDYSYTNIDIKQLYAQVFALEEKE